MIASGLLNSGFQALAIGICIERDNGGLKRLAGTPMPRASYFTGKFLLVATISVLQIALLIGVGVAFFGLDWPTPCSAGSRSPGSGCSAGRRARCWGSRSRRFPATVSPRLL